MNKLYIELEEPIIEVKVNKQKIKVKTYIKTEEEIAFTKVCLDYFNNNGIESIGVVKRIFDVCVLAKLTSIKIDGVSITENAKKEIEINLDSTKSDWDALASVGVTSNLLSFVANYDLVWHNIETAIKLQNTRNSFVDFAKMIPNFKDMEKALEKSVNSIVNLRESDKKKFDMVMENVISQKKAEMAKEEEQKPKAKPKAKTKTKKVKG